MQLKHLFVFLLVFFISVAESNFYSQENTSSYYQSSKLIHKRKYNYRNTKQIIFNNSILSNKYFLDFFFPQIDVKKEHQKQILLVLNFQKQLHQKIASQNIQHSFLIKKNTSSNSISNLYIA